MENSMSVIATVRLIRHECINLLDILSKRIFSFPVLRIGFGQAGKLTANIFTGKN